MNTFTTVDAVNEYRNALSGQVGCVPTMGAIHEGHLALVEQALMENDHVVVTLFVNPKQFNDPADLAGYPRRDVEDIDLLNQTGVSAVFMPTVEVMYAPDDSYLVNESCESLDRCGSARPGHFSGVLTVVMKLLNIIKPHRAYFGEKDYQQLELIRGMVTAFFMPVEVVGVPTMRAPDGLALSSRNALLGSSERALAPRLFQYLNSDDSDYLVKHQLEKAGFTVDYVQTRKNRRYAAVFLGQGSRQVRLIDNVRLTP
ncbi:MAG: pantoate--beta-alanine ligase [Pseudomonadales bacterium]